MCAPSAYFYVLFFCFEKYHDTFCLLFPCPSRFILQGFFCHSIIKNGTSWNHYILLQVLLEGTFVTDTTFFLNFEIFVPSRPSIASFPTVPFFFYSSTTVRTLPRKHHACVTTNSQRVNLHPGMVLPIRYSSACVCHPMGERNTL